MKPDDFDAERPMYLLLGWTDGSWSLVTKHLMTFGECCRVHEGGMAPYERFLTVSRPEFETIGMPEDIEASEYFSTERQREVSLRSNSGRQERKHGKD